MAQDLRTRKALIAAIAAIAAIVIAYWCWPRAVPAAVPRHVDSNTIAEQDVAAAVLDECHRPLRGQMGRVTATVTSASLGEVQVFAELPDRMRVQGGSGSLLVLQDEVLPLAAETAPPSADECTRLRDLRVLLDAAAFGPLHRATACRRLATDTYALTQPDGSIATLRLRPGTLLPAALQLGGREVRLLDYLRTSTTWIVSQAAVAALGTCRIHFTTSINSWDASFFDRPEQKRPPSASQVIPVPGVSIESRSPTPILIEGKAMRWSVVDDPGDWPGRVAAYLPLHRELERQEQQIYGFPGFWQEGDRQLLGAPFRQREDGPGFTTPSGWHLVDVEAGRWLVVYPIGADLTAKLATGRRQLQEAIISYRLTARGAIVAQPYLHLEDGPPPADKLQNPTLRMAVAVR